jgi:proline iminopeptidase
MKYLFVLLLTAPFCCFGQTVKSFRNADVELFYEEFGKGPALYILTGGPGAPPGDPSYRIIDSLKTNYTCVLLHQRGTGRSRNIPVNDQTISIKNYTEDIELLRKARQDKKIILLGISWGGSLAMNYTAKYPANVAKLVLVASGPPSYKLWNVLYDNQYSRRSKSELDSMQMLYGIVASTTDKELDSLKRANPLDKVVLAFKSLVAIHIRSMYYDLQTLPAGFDEFFEAFNFQPIAIIDKEILQTKWNVTGPLKELDIPALIVYGRQDDQGESTFYLQKESLIKSEMHVIEKCGHILWEDQPMEFYNILMKYLL